MVVLKELIFNSFYFRPKDVVVLKELIVNILHFGRVCWS